MSHFDVLYEENRSESEIISIKMAESLLKDDIDTLATAKKILFQLMSGYAFRTKIESQKIYRMCNFTDYLSSKSSRYFLKLFEDRNEYNQVGFITSWKYISEDGNNTFLYVSGIEKYSHDMNDTNELISLNLEYYKGIILLGCNNNIIRNYNDIIYNAIKSCCKYLQIFNSYNDAKEYLSNIGNFKVTSFGTALNDALRKKKDISISSLV